MLGCIVVCLGVPYLAPADPLRYHLALQGVAAITQTLTLVGAWRHRRSLGSVALLLVASSMLFGVADGAATVNIARSVETPFPSWLDALYLSTYVAFTAAALIITRHRSPGRDAGALLDAATLMVGVGVLAYSFSIADIAADSSATPAAKAVGLLYPLADVLEVGVMARLIFTGRQSAADRAPVLFLVGGATCQLIGDIGFTLSVYAGRGYGPWVDGLYSLSGALVAFSLWQKETDRLLERAESGDDRLGPGRMAVLAAGALLAPVTLVVQDTWGHEQHVKAVAVGAMLLFGLTLARMRLLIQAVEKQSRQLAVLARTDALTGLANRRTFEFELGRAMQEVRDAEAEGRRRPLSVGLIDLDRFKQFNDAHGHSRGDELLKECAAHWTDALARLAPGAVMARYGGEEFVVVFRDLEPGPAAVVLRRLMEITPMAQSFSAGVAAWDGAEPALTLLNRADTRLYAAKAAGRRAVHAGGTDLAEAVGRP